VTPDETFEALQRGAAPARIPVATYRLQLSPALTFDDAAALVPYLDRLGITDGYTSPFFETSSRGSHGYDVSDHNRLREELGGEAAFARFGAALTRQRMGLLIDLVPNHMGIAGDRNAWWMDLLTNGPSSPYASFFDVDWRPVKRELADKVLLPILGDQYGAVLDRGELRLELTGGAFRVRYHETVLPIHPSTYARVLGYRLDELQATLGPEHPALVELKEVIGWFATLPGPADTKPDRLPARERDVETGRQRLDELLRQSGDVRDFVEANLRLYNGTPGDSASFDLLDALLDEQAYRLAYWRVAGEEINYRRFFDVNDLAAIRMEDPRVFAETHRLVFRLVREGVVTGLRIDHPDGLYAPAQYFRRLQRGCFLESARRLAGVGGDEGEWRDSALLARYDAAVREGAPPVSACYIVAEKILAVDERLPAIWPVDGTTGYEFLNRVNGIFVDRTRARAIDDLYARLLRRPPSFDDVVYESKRLIMDTAMASEINVLAHRLNVISEKHRSSRDFTLASLHRALREIIAAFPVYRTYAGDTGGETSDPGRIEDRDRDAIARAVARAKSRAPATMNVSVFDWIADILALRFPPWAQEADRCERLDFAMRFQQTTGPVTAKGYEDTALYRYHRLVSLNEVGGDPHRFGTPLAEFHAAMAARQAETPHGLSATATHDTKRGEDVRARINVLSEIPAEWRQRVARWQRLNRKHKGAVDGAPVPSAREEYLLYQTLVGAWPIEAERVQAYLLKALHEAKERTSWVNPNPRYDEAIARFAEAILDPHRSREFLRDLVAFQERVAHFGIFNSLAQVLIKITAPGVPDFYQGTELWDLSLVDPDNRRPVDFERRRRLLDELVERVTTTDHLAGLAAELLKNAEDGRVKMFVTRQALVFRRDHAALFAGGAYRALDARGTHAEHCCAFARVREGEAAVVVVPRLLARRGGSGRGTGMEVWSDTEVVLGEEGGRRFRNIFTNEEIEAPAGALPLVAAFASFPLALLERIA
jgi:(1->4)-alpha-D-glucan 1-alpha-D-glucosylmutase